MADLHIGPDTASPEEADIVDAFVAAHGGPAVRRVHPRMILGGTRAARDRRHLLLPLLVELQKQVGWISPGATNRIAESLEIPPAEVFGVASFYHLLDTKDPGDRGPVVHVCDDIVCGSRGGTELAGALSATGIETRTGPCLGRCESPAAALVRRPGVGDVSVGGATVEKVTELLSGSGGEGGRPQVVGRPGVLLRRVGVVDPTSLEDYRAHGGYRGLARALEIGPDRVVAAVTGSGLAGRGGAAFPTGRKWAAVASAPPGPREVVANADESEPGTFKDRVLLESDPFALIEGLTIAGFATGAARGWIYLRGEYPEAAATLDRALGAARAAGLLGSDVAGSGFAFDIELRSGAGAYICGEETALFNSIEGFRGEPRNKPPYPTVAGLFGRPTAVNNVETLANIAPLLTGEAAADTKLFPVSGAVARPGLYELPLGATLGEVLAAAGGPAGDAEPAAILIGGAAGTFVGPDDMDLVLTPEATRAAGVGLGSGAIVVFDSGADMGPILERITRFFREESCGQCVPCRVGTVRQHEQVEALVAGGSSPPHRLALLADLAGVMSDASICGLGHTAAGALRSALALGLLPGGSGEGDRL